MWGLGRESARAFKFMEMVDPSDGEGRPGVDAYPAPDQNKQLRMDPGEVVLARFAASTFRVTNSDLDDALSGNARWEPVDRNFDELIGRSNGSIIVTNLRVVPLISKMKMPTSSLLKPGEWMVKAMMNLDKDMKATIIAGHAPLESIFSVEPGKKKLRIAVALKTTSFARAFQVEANMRQPDMAALANAVQSAAKARWTQYELPEAVAAVVQQPYPLVGSPIRMVSPLVRPLGGTAGFVAGTTRAGNPELPEELRYVEVGRKSVSADDVSAARNAAQAKIAESAGDGPLPDWTCDECGCTKNKGGRLRCIQCRRDTGHLAQQV